MLNTHGSAGDGSTGSSSATTVPASTLSVQQQRVVDWVRNGTGSAFVEAVAGSGKTHTLVAACRAMVGRIAFAAFNKKIADELKIRTRDAGNVRVGTFHSFGLSAWRRLAGACVLDGDGKTRQMLNAENVPYPLRGAVSKLVSLAKQQVVGVLWQSDDRDKWVSMVEHHDVMLLVDDPDGTMSETVMLDSIIDYAVECVEWARENGKTIIDFDDMLWLPLVYDAPVDKYDWVLVDEAQDTNPARRLLATRMMRTNGRALWVGDRYQSIYGFTGADAGAVDMIVNEFACELLPLTVTYRCSKAATRRAQEFVPEITAHESNAEGSDVYVSGSLLGSLVEGRAVDMVDDTDAPPQYTRVDPFRPGDAVLCRNTRPLVALAFELIRNGIGCHVEGRDIGKSLGRLVSRWKVDSIRAVGVNLEAYRQKETDKLLARDAKYAIEALNDRVNTVLVLMEDCDTVSEVLAKIDTMFKDSESGGGRTVTLSTIHRAKGREWDRVFVLGWDTYMPSKYAQQPWQREQERNLQYVAVTRARRDLVLTGAWER